MAEGYERARTSRQSYVGDSEFTVDFGNSTISGRLYNFERDPNSTHEIAGLNPGNIVATIPVTPFDDKGFKGSFEIAGLNSGANISAAYEGSFFGPDANSVAGTISGVYDAPNQTDSTIVGFFATGKRE